MTTQAPTGEKPAPAPWPRSLWSPPDRARPKGSGDTRRSLGQLALLVLVVVAAALATHTTDLLVVIVALVVMIMLHELGHFATAKWSHMKVTEYFLGFGPRLWSVRKGETEYGIKAIPAGGYVRIVGMSNLEEVDPADEPRTYRQQPFHNRLMVALAGSGMHAVMALVLLWALFAFVGIVPDKGPVVVQQLSPLAHHIDPAAAAGVRSGDRIVAVDGKTVSGPDMLVKAISSHPGQPVTLRVSHGGSTRTVTVVPAAERNGSTTVGRIGVVLSVPAVTYDPVTAVGHAVTGFGVEVSASVSAMGQIFSAHGLSQYWHDLTNSKAATASEHSTLRVQSIYGAVRTAVQGAQSGVGGLLLVLIAINIFVGMLNLLPMLPLDGGHVAIAVYERIRSRRGRPYRADVRKLAPVAYAFVLFLGFIVVSALYLDITHPLANPFH
ncbi:MAG: M50 family metallopeptidase [Acidimicrobiales bacterium]